MIYFRNIDYFNEKEKYLPAGTATSTSTTYTGAGILGGAKSSPIKKDPRNIDYLAYSPVVGMRDVISGVITLGDSEDALNAFSKDYADDGIVSKNTKNSVEEALNDTNVAILNTQKTLAKFKKELEEERQLLVQLEIALDEAKKSLSAANAMPCDPIPCPDPVGSGLTK